MQDHEDTFDMQEKCMASLSWVVPSSVVWVELSWGWGEESSSEIIKVVLKYPRISLRNYCPGWVARWVAGWVAGRVAGWGAWWAGGWVCGCLGGWLDQLEIRLTSALVWVEVELWLSLVIYFYRKCIILYLYAVCTPVPTHPPTRGVLKSLPTATNLL